MLSFFLNIGFFNVLSINIEYTNLLSLRWIKMEAQTPSL